jgi:hypothetical protein
MSDFEINILADYWPQSKSLLFFSHAPPRLISLLGGTCFKWIKIGLAFLRLVDQKGIGECRKGGQQMLRKT